MPKYQKVKKSSVDSKKPKTKKSSPMTKKKK